MQHETGAGRRWRSPTCSSTVYKFSIISGILSHQRLFTFGDHRVGRWQAARGGAHAQQQHRALRLTLDWRSFVRRTKFSWTSVDPPAVHALLIILSPVLSSYSSNGGVNELEGTSAERKLSRRVRSSRRPTCAGMERGFAGASVVASLSVATGTGFGTGGGRLGGVASLASALPYATTRAAQQSASTRPFIMHVSNDPASQCRRVPQRRGLDYGETREVHIKNVEQNRRGAGKKPALH